MGSASRTYLRTYARTYARTYIRTYVRDMKSKHPIDQKRLQGQTTSANITFRGSNTAANYLFAEALAEAFHTNFVNFTKMGLQNCIKNQ